MSKQLSAGYNSVKEVVLNSLYRPFFFQPFYNTVGAENNTKMAWINMISVIKKSYEYYITYKTVED